MTQKRPLSIIALFNAQTLNYQFDNQAFMRYTEG
jgi:hypothetical protein